MEVSVAPGSNALRVFPEDDGYVVSDLIRFEGRYHARSTLQIALHRATTLEVIVQGPEAAPVAGSTVELIDPAEFAVGTEPMGARAHAAPVDGWGPTNLAPPSAHLLLDEKLSDASGRVTLSGPADRRLVLCVTGRGHEPVLQEIRLPDLPDPLVIQVTPHRPRG